MINTGFSWKPNPDQRLVQMAYISLCNAHNLTYRLLEYVLEITFNSQTCLISKEMKPRTTF